MLLTLNPHNNDDLYSVSPFSAFLLTYHKASLSDHQAWDVAITLCVGFFGSAEELVFAHIVSNNAMKDK